MGPWLFLIYNNDLRKIRDNDNKVGLSAGDTSITVTNSNQEGLEATFKTTLTDITARFEANFLSLNFNKMYYLEFRTKNCIDTTLDIIHFNTSTVNVTYIQCLGLVTDDPLTWNNHTE